MPHFTHGLAQSFRAAWRGLLLAFKSERTFRVMIALGLMVIATVSTMPLAVFERLLLLLLTGFVLVLELLNSMVERLADLLKPRLSAYVGEVKDLMAAAVLMASFFAVLIACFILFPHLVTLVGQL
ncbi:MAG TPA: diacylglycerol kinase [Candidatus Methylomirabilis sp.]|nr:diacylglycerol kinase [Candidatus Methylomirabilis sp.]